MAAASKSHNLLAQSVALDLRMALRGNDCQVFKEDARLVVKENNHYAYPDVLVGCDPADRHDAYLARQPVLIVEVLSPSIAEYDRTGKFGHYRKLLSLRHYLLVLQAAWAVEWFRRDEDRAVGLHLAARARHRA